MVKHCLVFFVQNLKEDISMRQGVLLSRSLFRFGERVGAKPDNDRRARKRCKNLFLDSESDGRLVETEIM